MATTYSIPEKHAGKIPAISVRQPYAEMIMRGIKNLEFRTWSTKYRGPILIHASNTLPSDHIAIAQYDIGCSRGLQESLDRGGYLGVVSVDDCIVYNEEDKESETPREYAIILYAPVNFDEMIPGKGAANFFYPTDEDWKKLKPVVDKALKELNEILAEEISEN